MSLGTAVASLNSVAKNFIIGQDTSGNIAAAHVLVNSTGAEIGTPQSPLTVQNVGAASTGGVSTAVESGHVLKASPGTLYFVTVTVSAAGYLMLFNSAAVPADGTITPANAPVYLGQAGTYTIDYGPSGKTFSVGIAVAFSSTGPLTKTASATAFFEWSVA